MKQNLKNGIAVHVYDVVAYFKVGKPVKGTKEFEVEYNGAKYYFKNVLNKESFQNNPDHYIPQYGGFCSIAMSEGALVDPGPKSFLIQDSKLFLFTRRLFGIINVKRQWLKAPEEKRALADKEWEKLKNKD